MNYERQQRQLSEALDHMDQARLILQDLAESCMQGGEESPDDEVEDAAEVAEELENAVAVLEELSDTLDSLR